MNINLEQLLVWDIETVPQQGFNKDNPLWDTWKHRNRKENLTDEELLDKFSKEGGLFGEYLTIVCISCAFIHNGEIRIASFTGEEKHIIDEFLKVAAYVNNKTGNVISLGHNIQNYDVPVTRKVYSRYYPMFTYPDYVSDISTKGKFPVAEKPWVLSERFFDTLQLQKGGNYMFSSMAEVAISLGIPTPKLDTNGSMVAEIFKQGDIARIAKYCEGDVLTSLAIAFNWLGLEMLPIAKRNEEIVVEKVPVLKRIYRAKEITTEDKKELQELLRGKKFTKRNKEILIDMLHQVSINSEMFSADKKEIVDEKMSIVQELIKSL